MKDSALLIIDMQNGLFKKQRKIFNESKLLHTINLLIKNQKSQKLPVVFIQHNNKLLQRGTKNWEIHNALITSKDDVVIQKTKGNAFTNFELNDILKANKIKNIIITGLVSNGCVRHTCLGGKKLGYNVILVYNGHSTWNVNAEINIKKVHVELEQHGVLSKSLDKVVNTKILF